MRFLPRNLAGQMVLLIGVALLVAQLANLALLLNEREKANLAQAEGPAVARFVSVAGDHILEGRVLSRGRFGRFNVVEESSVAEADRRPGLEARVRNALTDAGVTVSAVRATRRDTELPRMWDWRDGQGPRWGDDGRRGDERGGGQAPGRGQPRDNEAREARSPDAPRSQTPPSREPQARQGRPADAGQGRPPWADGPGFDGMPRSIRQVILSVQLADGRWLEARLPTPKRDPAMTARLITATVVLYLIVLGVTLLIAGWLSRPLRDLTTAAEGFAGRGDGVEVRPRGPGDLRRLIVAFNGMKARMAGLLDEKDRMLGAIGHDLRTPLASLRIRVENLEPGEERDRMIATLREAAAMLEDILVLARTGRAREEARDVDLAALLDAVAEEYGEMGRPVTLAPAPRTVARVQTGLLRRAIRNLVDNAVTYGGSARLSLTREDGETRITVSDDGPGIAEGDLERVLSPFERGEESRNRETGGSGLGLAIADAIVQGHGGRLVLANRAGGGLDATLVLPG
jgi:signal transduction histidine kinase